MRKIFIVLGLMLLSIMSISTKTYAINYDVGLNIPQVFPFLDEFTYDSGASDVISYAKTSGLLAREYTLVFKDDVPEFRSDFTIAVGNYFDDLESITMTDSDTTYFQIKGSNAVPYVNVKLSGMMFYVNNPNYLDEQLVSFKSTLTGVLTHTLRELIEEYLYIIYDSPNDIVERAVSYYNSVSGDDYYDEGYEDGLLDGTGNYSDGYIIGYDAGYTLAYDEGYDTGQIDILTNGSSYYGYNIETSYDYDVGIDVGSLDNVNAGLTTFTTNFDKWIVPAIVLVILLGGFTTIAIRKRNGE